MKVLYKTLNMKPLPPPFRLEVESNAPADGHMLIGTGPWNSLEIIFGANGASFSAIRWLSSGNPTPLTAFDGSPQKDAQQLHMTPWKVQDGRLGVVHGTAEWGFYVPEHYLGSLRQHPVQIYVGVPGDVSKRTEPRDDWSTTLRTVRAAACSAAGVAARSFVAHVVCNEGTEALISDLQMLPNLVELQLVWWPSTHRLCSPEACYVKQVTRALPALERLDELFAHGAQRPQTLETQQAHHLRTCAPVQGCPLCAQHLRDRD
eukprot:g6987.t1